MSKTNRVLITLVFILLFATLPAHSANPFIDLPSGHWAYSAIETLASQGIISGYENGTFKGGKTITRYEAASMLARALANIDEKTATKEQLNIVKNMCVEFKDELDALGVRVSSLENDMKLFQDRLGGWSLSGNLQLDTNILQMDEADGNRVQLAQSRLYISRRFGADESMLFHAQLDGSQMEDGDYAIEFTKFYVGMTLANEWRFTVGRFSMDFEGDGMYYAAGRFADYSQGAWFTDVDRDAVALTKRFSIGNFSMYIAGRDIADEFDSSVTVAGFLAFKPSEKFHVDVGLEYKNVRNDNSPLDDMTTFWIMPKYFITSDVALKGAFYAQFNSYNNKTDVENEHPTAWRVILDVKQSLLKYTGLWLEYDKFDHNFVLSRGTTSLLLADNDYRNFFQTDNLGADLSVWRVGMNQEWNSKWSSWLYYAKYDYGNYATVDGTFVRPSMDEFSVGIEYRLNSSAYFSLGYFYYKFDDDALLEKKRVLNFRTSIAF